MIKTIRLPSQINIVNKIKDLDAFALLSEYGTGKTLCALKYIDLKKSSLQNGVLVVSKRNTIISHKSTWPLQIKKHTDFSYQILVGNSWGKQLQMIQDRNNFIHLISYESVPGLLLSLKKRNYSMIVFDESHKIKNYKAQITKAAHKLARTIPIRCILTGAIATEHMRDIWSQIYIIDFGEALGKTFWEFLKKYFYKWRFGYQLKKGCDQVIIDKIKAFSVFKELKEVIDLPKINDYYIPLEPSDDMKSWLKQIKEDFEVNIQGTPITFDYILPTLMKMQQICSGFVYIKDSNGTQKPLEFNTPKDKALLDILSSIHEGKMILWCKFNYELDKLSDLLYRKGYHTITIQSSNSPSAINAKLSNFRSSKKVTILLVTYDFFSAGETLVEANHAIHYSYDWSYRNISNAKARIYRKGAEIHKEVNYYHLYVQKTIEEAIIKVLGKKKSMVRKLKNFMKAWVQK